MANVNVCSAMKNESKTQTSIIELQDRYKELDKAQKMIPSIICNDLNCRRLRYVRYADDFLIGITYHRSEAVEIMSKIEQFIKEKLNLDISAEKTGNQTCQRREGTHFLSYDILISNNRKLRWKINKGIRYKQRTSAVAVQLEVPWEKVRKIYTEIW